jgi:predicted Rossmann fold nucleotide-binding protein DprA/Smf involved in DNA uptake
VRGGQDVLDLLFGAGLRRLPTARAAELPPELRELLSAIAAGHDTAAALERAGFPAEHGLAGLAELELSGRIRRLPGGRFAVIP